MMCVAKKANENIMPTNTMTASIEAASEESSSRSPSASSSVHRRSESDKEPNNNDQENANNTASNNEAASEDYDGCTDEVKVFNDEDERDADASESYQAELQAEKSSLIHESEQHPKILEKDLIFRHANSEDLSPSAAALAAASGIMKILSCLHILEMTSCD